MPHCRHLCPGHVESQTGRAEEPGMAIGGNMLDEPQVGSPWKVVRIPGSAQEETAPGAAACRLDEQHFQLGLPVVGVGSEIGKVGAGLWPAASRAVRQGVDMSVQGCDPPGPQQLFHGGQGSAAGIAEDEIEAAQPGGGQVVNGLAGIETRQRNGRVQVVKHMQRRGGRVESESGCAVGIGAVRSDEGGVRVDDLSLRLRRNRAPVAVKHQFSARKGSEVAVSGVVGHVLLEKDDLVPAQAQRRNQPAPQCGMTVTPR